MVERLLLVAPAGHDRDALKGVLRAAGYEVVESASRADGGRAPDDVEPDLILIDHEAGDSSRQALRGLVPDSGPEAPPVVEMCLDRPEMYSAAAVILERVSGRTRRWTRRRTSRRTSHG